MRLRAVGILAVGVTVLACSATTASASPGCTAEPDTTRPWKTDAASRAFERNGRLFGCFRRESYRLGTADGVRRVDVNGRFLALVRRRRGACPRVEVIHMPSRRRTTRARFGCRRRVAGLAVTAAGDAAVLVPRRASRAAVIAVTGSRRNVLDSRADRRLLYTGGHNSVRWQRDGRRHNVVLGRDGCTPQDEYDGLRFGTWSAWTESQIGPSDEGWDVVLACDDRLGRIEVLDFVFVGAFSCTSTGPVALQPPSLAILYRKSTTNCMDSENRVAVIDLRTAKTTVGTDLGLNDEPDRTRLTPAGNLLLAVPGLDYGTTPPTRFGRIVYATRDGSSVLDADPRLATRSLGLTGSRASWTVGGEPRGADTP